MKTGQWFEENRCEITDSTQWFVKNRCRTIDSMQYFVEMYDHLRRLWNNIRIFFDVRWKVNKCPRKWDILRSGMKTIQNSNLAPWSDSILNFLGIAMEFLFSFGIMWTFGHTCGLQRLETFPIGGSAFQTRLNLNIFVILRKSVFFDGSHRLFLNTSIHPYIAVQSTAKYMYYFEKIKIEREKLTLQGLFHHPITLNSALLYWMFVILWWFQWIWIWRRF